ncbi:hypothetical protein T492DRAFT_284958 [Pavlovales sp. CCMP2436]|nr:hypothetical protein T492DRAFT_284958 [Pavlovales sp. CCMP2436]
MYVIASCAWCSSPRLSDKGPINIREIQHTGRSSNGKDGCSSLCLDSRFPPGTLSPCHVSHFPPFAAQRFNVAITRAKSLLVIVGNPHALAVDPSWRSLLAHALERGCYRGVPFSLTEGRGGRGERGARAENDEGGDDEGEEEDAEAMLSRLAESALGGAYGARGGELDHLDLSFDLEWRLMI